MKFTGIGVAILELICFYKVSNHFLETNINLTTIDSISYYWLMFTVLTGIWEYTFVTNRKEIEKKSCELLIKKEHVWSNIYPVCFVLPWNLSKIFYAEYGAYADREYMIVYDNWSKIIEGTHEMCCGLTAALGIYSKSHYYHDSYLIMCSISMASQLMNSILYMSEYNIQRKTKKHINYDRKEFPCGKYMQQRPFMYINVFWTVMPAYVLYMLYF